MNQRIDLKSCTYDPLFWMRARSEGSVHTASKNLHWGTCTWSHSTKNKFYLSNLIGRLEVELDISQSPVQFLLLQKRLWFPHEHTQEEKEFIVTHEHTHIHLRTRIKRHMDPKCFTQVLFGRMRAATGSRPQIFYIACPCWNATRNRE